MVFFVFVFSIHFPLVSAAWLVGQRCGCVRTQPGTQRKKSHHGDLAAPAGLATPTTPNPRGALPTPPTHLRVPASPARLAPQRSGPEPSRRLCCALQTSRFQVPLLCPRGLLAACRETVNRSGCCNHTFRPDLLPALGEGVPPSKCALWVLLPSDNFGVFFAPVWVTLFTTQ